MGFDWNVFRIMADVSHTLSKCILIFSIHSNKSAEGVSLITQLLYLVVFCSRYLFLPLWSAYDRSEFHKIWNLTLKMFYILSSAYIVFLMMRVYARTREREKAWKLGVGSFAGSAIAAPFIMLTLKSRIVWGFPEISWIFSILLESLCILPQLLLLRQTTVPTVIDSFYLATLGSYRFFYVLNWLVRAVRDQDVDVVSVVFGLIQTALYVDFAWVYWTRQRVKLRGGSVIDSGDLGKGWLVKRLVGRRGEGVDADGDAESDGAVAYNDHGNDLAPAAPGNTNPARAAAPAATSKSKRTLGGLMGGNWRGSRNKQGISISADDGVHDIEAGGADTEDDGLAPPDQFEDEMDDDAPGVFRDEDRRDAAGQIRGQIQGQAADERTKIRTRYADDEDEYGEDASNVDTAADLVGNGSEWRDGDGDGRDGRKDVL